MWSDAATPQTKTGFAPLAIGLMIGCLSYIGGSVSGGCFNPARLFAPGKKWTEQFTDCFRLLYLLTLFVLAFLSDGLALWSNRWSDHWLYWIAELLGASVAAVLRHLFSHSFGNSAQYARKEKEVQKTMETIRRQTVVNHAHES